MRIIELKTLRSTFDRDTGTPIKGEDTDYACESCRHLVGRGDKFCWQCGEELEPSELVVEYYHKGKKLSGEEYNERRK